ncbi:peptidoglycan-binding protein, partial [Litorisediminicola beolgyonensis]
MALARRGGQKFQASIWPGFVDAMTGLLLVLMFVLTIFMVVQAVLRETITGQESELSNLAAEVAALAETLGLEEAKTAALSDQMGALAATLDDREARLAQQRQLIASLTEERDAQGAALAQAETRIEDFETQVAALLAGQTERDETIAALNADAEELAAARDEALSERDELNLALARARSEIDAGTEAARLAAARREALEALVEDLRGQNADQEARIGALSGEVD